MRSASWASRPSGLSTSAARLTPISTCWPTAALSVRLLSRPDARVATVIGAGVQGREHLRLLPLVRDFTRSNVCSLRLADASLLETVRAEIGALPEVAETEVDTSSGRLTAFPADGRLPLMPIGRLADRHGWKLDELQLETGRLDEVFRTITGGASA